MPTLPRSRTIRLPRLALAALAFAAFPSMLQAQAAARCSPSAAAGEAGSGRALVVRAIRAVGMDRANGRLLRYEANDNIAQFHQSDRMYAPYLVLQWGGPFYVDPTTGAARFEEIVTGGGSKGRAPFVLLSSAKQSYAVARDTLFMPASQDATLRSRPLDAWLMLLDFASGDTRTAGRCVVRDFPREVVTRSGPYGEERLYLDPKSGLPVMLARREPHYLWGDVLAEYVYSNWTLVQGALVATGAARMQDGENEITRVTGSYAFVPRDSAPRVTLPDGPSPMPAGTPAARPSDAPPDTVRVDANTFLLVTRFYTNVVTLQRDTVFVLDAQTSETRAAQDSAWIGRLFPGRHAIALVVSDLAWPHVSGVRYWVAQGATVYSHATSRAFLERLVARRWTLRPDRLEKVRASKGSAVTMRFRSIGDSLSLAGGALKVRAIDGIGSEGALMTFAPASRFLYAGDYVQSLGAPSAYLNEVAAAAARAGFAPERVAAMHHPGTLPWSRIEGLVQGARAALPANANR